MQEAISTRDQAVARGFDRLAGIYDHLVRLVFGQQLRRAQCAWLSKLPQAGRILIIGGGTGWILKEIAAKTAAHIDYIELSPEMLARSQQCWQTVVPTTRATVRFIHGSETAIPETPGYDAVITFFFLDLFMPVRFEQVMNRLDGVLNPDGKWFFADFVPQKGMSTQWQWGLLWIMYRFFRWACRIEGSQLLPFEAAFFTRGYQLEKRKLFAGGMVRSDCWKKRT